MPESPSVDLEAIKESAKKIVEELGGTNKEYSEEPVAFGLKAVIVFFFYPDDKSVEDMEDKLQSIENVQSATLIDMRKVA